MREFLSDNYPDTIMLPEEFDGAILCLCERIGNYPFIVYDTDKVIEVLQSQGMSHEEAIDYFGFNIAGAYVGETTPGYTMDYYE